MVLKTAARTSSLVAGAALLTLIATACGDDDPAEPASTGDSIKVQSVDQMGDVLVDSSGMALYTSDLEADGSIKCVKSCLDIWEPVVLPDGTNEAPAAPDGVTAKLGVTKRPDTGDQQVTLDGKPLYQFTIDKQAGKVGGHLTEDDFEGLHFIWFVATPTGEEPSGPGQPKPTDTGYDYY